MRHGCTTSSEAIEATTIATRLGVIFLFVLLNGFFVAAEFALVKARRTRLRALADGGRQQSGDQLTSGNFG